MTSWTADGLVLRAGMIWSDGPSRRRAARLCAGRDEVWRCEHHHETKDGAMRCAFAAWQQLRDGLR